MPDSLRALPMAGRGAAAIGMRVENLLGRLGIREVDTATLRLRVLDFGVRA